MIVYIPPNYNKNLKFRMAAIETNTGCKQCIHVMRIQNDEDEVKCVKKRF